MEQLREELVDYLNGISKEEELLSIAEIGRCCVCGEYMLEEDMHEYTQDEDKNKYCDICWEARD